jgi:hypothetical protein
MRHGKCWSYRLICSGEDLEEEEILRLTHAKKVVQAWIQLACHVFVRQYRFRRPDRAKYGNNGIYGEPIQLRHYGTTWSQMLSSNSWQWRLLEEISYYTSHRFCSVLRHFSIIYIFQKVRSLLHLVNFTENYPGFPFSAGRLTHSCVTWRKPDLIPSDRWQQCVTQ